MNKKVSESQVQDMPVLGKEGEGFTEEELKDIQMKQNIRKVEIMDDLDKIQAPIMCTVILPETAFEYRNEAFWKALAEKDRAIRQSLTDYLNRKKNG